MISVDRDVFIAAMRCVASSVCVVTTDGSAGRHGATVSAFCSVSADPPTVLVCLNMTSKIAQLVRENGVFKVSILPDGAKHIAERFAGMHDSTVADRFEGIETSGALHGITGATILSCTLSQAVEEGSHLVCMGRVQDVTLGANLPLTYLAGRYHPLSREGIAQ
jgi:flavin reductase (DIM6/NTAB) family NADH-FMN oxidoreductase RutF